MENTTGQDLFKILWLKSPSSEVWLERRTAFSRSLAVMSIVGYILGLGDRHPSNIMLDRYSGGMCLVLPSISILTYISTHVSLKAIIIALVFHGQDASTSILVTVLKSR